MQNPLYQIPAGATLVSFREVTGRVNGAFTYGRTIAVPCRKGKPALKNNPYMPGTFCATIKVGPCAYSDIVIDPATWQVRK